MTDSTQAVDRAAVEAVVDAAPDAPHDSPAPPPPGRPCWIELHTRDVEASAAFYRELLGWEITAGQEGDPLSNPVVVDGEPVASIEPWDPQDGFTGWLVALAAPGGEAAAVSRAQELGGRVIIPVTEVEPGRFYALLADPSGARVGLLTDDAALPPAPAPGLPVWHEVLTRDLEADAAFYREVFGWDTHPEPSQPEGAPGYLLNGSDPDTAVCGIGGTGFLGDRDEPGWRVYLAVADVDEAARTATRLGGEVISGPGDSPYGRILGVRDPQGARLRLVELPAQG